MIEIEIGNLEPMIIHKGVAKLLDLHLMFMLIPEDLANDLDVPDQSGTISLPLTKFE